MVSKNTDAARPSPILLVEDDAAHAELLRNCFPNELATIYHVEHGEDALDFLHRLRAYADPKLSPRPRLILLDLHIPRIDGLEILRQVKASAVLRTIPVVILSTSEAAYDIDQAYKSCANDYVVKPSDFGAFTKTMTMLGSYWLGEHRAA